MVRFTPLKADDSARSVMNRLIQVGPDCFVMTDREGLVVVANGALVELSQVASEEEACGQRLDRWLGRTAVDFDVLLTNLRQYGSVRLFVTTLRGTQGNMAEVEVSAVSVISGCDQLCGFSIRDIGRRLGGSATSSFATERQQPRSLKQLTELVGRVPLKALVGETTDIIERLCIDAALELTQDNRAAAAEMLGLSRQSLLHGDTMSIGTGSANKGFSLRGLAAEMRKACGMSELETLRHEGAPIPMKPVKRWDNGRDVLLAGDAASVVATASDEGIYYTMPGGQFAVEAAALCLTTGEVSALQTVRKKFMKAHGRVFWILGVMQSFWYSSDKRRERFVTMYADPDVQRLTWQGYMHKNLVKADPMAHARIFLKDMAHLAGLVRP